MLLRELFLFENKQPVAKTSADYGRPFNHPEHMVFFGGVDGTLEALNRLRAVTAEKQGGTTLRVKWDGAPQIYWGRAKKGGPLVLAGHNGWARGAAGTSQEQVYDFIANQSGNPKSPEEAEKRQVFAKNFANLYPLFDAATPKNFVGFVYADNLFGVDSNRPKTLKDGVWTFCPNPLSKTCYHVDATSDLGQRVSQAQVMVVGHGTFPTFGADDREQQPLDDFSMFNKTAGLIVQSPIYTSQGTAIDQSAVKVIDNAIEYASAHEAVIDGFLNSLPDPDKNGIFYPFANYLNKGGMFDTATGKTFLDWMTQKGVSQKKQQHIIEMIQAHPGGLDAILHLMKEIRKVKDAIYASAKSQDRPEVWDSDGEGYVQYAQKGHRQGHMKVVPTSWTP